MSRGVKTAAYGIIKTHEQYSIEISQGDRLVAQCRGCRSHNDPHAGGDEGTILQVEEDDSSFGALTYPKAHLLLEVDESSILGVCPLCAA